MKYVLNCKWRKKNRFYFLILSSFIFSFIIISNINFVKAEYGYNKLTSSNLEIINTNITNFTQLRDTPTSYSGSAGNCVIVNGGETALEFGSCSAVAQSNIFNQNLNTTNNVRFSNLTIINGGNITLNGVSISTFLYNQTAPANTYTDSRSFITSAIGNATYALIGSGGNASWNQSYANTLYQPIGIAFNSSYLTGNIFNQQLNVSSNVIFGNISSTGNITINGVHVCLANGTNCQASGSSTNVFDQDLNTTNNVKFANVTSNGNVTINSGTSGFNRAVDITGGLFRTKIASDTGLVLGGRINQSIFNSITANDGYMIVTGAGSGESYPFNSFGHLLIGSRNANDRDVILTTSNNTFTGLILKSTGLVGIGTNTPSQYLDIERGSVILTNDTTGVGYMMRDSTTVGLFTDLTVSSDIALMNTNNLLFLIDNNNNDADGARFFSVRANGINGSNASEFFRVNDAGNVRVGAGAPISRFDVIGNTTFSGGNFSINISNFFVNPFTGRVGINKTNPSTHLDVGGGVNIDGALDVLNGMTVTGNLIQTGGNVILIPTKTGIGDLTPDAYVDIAGNLSVDEGIFDQTYGHATATTIGQQTNIPVRFGNISTIVTQDGSMVAWDDTNDEWDVTNEGWYEAELVAQLGCSANGVVNVTFNNESRPVFSTPFLCTASADPMMVIFKPMIRTSGNISVEIDGTANQNMTFEAGSVFTVERKF